MNPIDRDFVPPHCPYRKCPHFPAPKEVTWLRKSGFHPALAYALVLRFRCKYCRSIFSRQTFDLHYFSERRLDWNNIREIERSCCTDGAKARELRKDLANHVRESTRFSREANHMAERVRIFPMNHNLNKKFRIKVRKDKVSWHWNEAGFEGRMVESGRSGKFLQRP